MFGILVGAQGLSTLPFPGLAAFSPVSTSWPLLQYPRLSPNPVIFGAPVPWIVMALLLYGSFGAWIVLMLLRNLKRDFQELRLLLRWEVVGCCAFLNFVLYSLFSPNVEVFRDTADLAEFMLAANGFFFFFLGLTMLDTPERLDATTSFSVRSLFSEHGLQWPWLLASSVTSYLLLIWGLLAWGRALPSSAGLPATAAIHLLIMTLFITRDVLFIQWCKLTGLRSPLMKGVLLLGLYYASVGVLCAVTEVSSDRFAIGLGNVLTPAAAFNRADSLLSITGTLGIVLQLMAIAFLVSAIHGRVGKIRLAAAAVAA
jgi:hypothetical protein